jgi:hypothetical protein
MTLILAYKLLINPERKLDFGAAGCHSFLPRRKVGGLSSKRGACAVKIHGLAAGDEWQVIKNPRINKPGIFYTNP